MAKYRRKIEHVEAVQMLFGKHGWPVWLEGELSVKDGPAIKEGDYLVITYQKNLNALGTLTIELSSDLITWNSGSNLTEFLPQVDNGNGTATVTVRLKNPVRIPSRSFARLRGE